MELYTRQEMKQYVDYEAERLTLELKRKLAVARDALFKVYVGATPDAYWWKDVVDALAVIDNNGEYKYDSQEEMDLENQEPDTDE